MAHECRSPELLVELVQNFPTEVLSLLPRRPLLATALADAGRNDLTIDLDAEVRAEMAKNRAYWESLKRELESMRLTEARQNRHPA